MFGWNPLRNVEELCKEYYFYTSRMLTRNKGSLFREKQWIEKKRQYALGHLIAIVVWKFGWKPLPNVVGVAHRRNGLYILRGLSQNSV